MTKEKAMAARSGQFKTDLSVALTAEIQAALETAVHFPESNRASTRGLR
jgi:hypothetical protein